MQIHELNEAGILQGIKGAASGVKGAVQGFQQGRKQRLDAQQLEQTAGIASRAWNKYAAQLKAATPDPTRYQQLYKQALQAFVQKNLLKGQTIANSINRQEITQLIDSITAQADNPTAVTQLFSNLVQQSALAQPDTATSGAQTLVRVVNPDPAVLQFRNKTYIINDQGEWADQVTGAVADQSFQAFLDQELAKAVPNAQQQLTPQPQQKIEYLAADPQWKNLDGVRGYQGKIWIKDKAGKWFNYNNNSPVEETRPAYIDTLNKLYNQVKPAGTAQPSAVDAALQQAGVDAAKLAQLQKLIKSDPAAADQLRKLLGL